MDIRQTTPPHIVFDGYHYANEKAWANRPCRIWRTRLLNLTIVAVLAGALFLALYAWNLAQGAPV